MNKTLVIYDTGYGATKFVAEQIAETLLEKGLRADLLRVGPVDLTEHDTVFVGTPIRFGRCTPRIKRFLSKNRSILSVKRVAFFFTCMSITSDKFAEKMPVYIDPAFNRPNRSRARIGFMEKNHTLSYYLEHLLSIIPGIDPFGISFFKGRLDTTRLGPVHRLIMAFAMLSLPEIRNGDYLNSLVIRSWVEALSHNIK